MIDENKPPAGGSEQSGLMVVLRILGLMLVAPALLLYLIAAFFL